MTTINDLKQDEAPNTTFSILEHLNELRIRLTWAAGGIFIFTILGFFFAETLLKFLLVPYAGELQVLAPTDGLQTFFRVAFTAGLIGSMPFTVYQIWLFIEPALTKSEKRYVYLFIPITLILFTLGILFAWFVLVPAAVGFLATFLDDIFKADWSSQEYVNFILSMVFWLGVSFEMPVIFYFVGRFGLLTAAALAEQWRYAVVGVSILAAAITPSIDPITMLLTMAPLLILYFLSIGTTRIGQRQFERNMEL